MRNTRLDWVGSEVHTPALVGACLILEQVDLGILIIFVLPTQYNVY